MPHFVYMLRCAGDRIYTGYAACVEARYKQHVEGKGARFTKAFPPKSILKTFELESKEYALRLEARIKKLTRIEKESLAAGNAELAEKLMVGLDKVLVKKKRRKKNESGNAVQSSSI